MAGMTTWKIIEMLALASLMAGCGTSTFEGVHPTFTVTAQPLVVSLTPSPRPIGTVGTQSAAISTANPFAKTAQAAPIPAGTITATATAPRALIGTIDRRCLPIAASLPQGSLAEGAVIVGDFTERSGRGPLLVLSSKDDRPRPLSEAPPTELGWASSPNAKWIAYPHVDERRDWTLIILDGNGKVHTSLMLEEPGMTFNWLDDER